LPLWRAGRPGGGKHRPRRGRSPGVCAGQALRNTATEYKDDDYKRYDELKQRSSHLMHEWEKACYELELVSE
ncbi:MAG: hypothetical protein IKC42_03630, partial [Alistipes sp.]|nr:hypothetical protein [Alistipes sp.]